MTIRDLRNRGGEVIDGVAAGGRVTVTRDGRPVAELRPLRVRGLTAAAVLALWRHLPAVEADKLREDLDAILDLDL